MRKHSLLLILLLQFSFSASATQADSLLQVLKTAKDTTKVHLLLDIAYEFTSSDPVKELSYLNQALEYSKKINYKKGEMRALTSMGVAYNAKQSVVESDSCLRIALVIAIELKDSNYIGNVYSNLGMTYFNKENFDTALQYYFKGLKYFEALNNEAKSTSAYNNIANLYYTQKDPKKALSYHMKSLAISRRLNDKSKIASSLNNIGIIYREEKETAEALKCFGEALQLAKEINHKFGQSLLLNNIGRCYTDLGDYEKAIKCFNEALALKIEIGDVKGIASCYMNLGEAYYKAKDYDKALEYDFKCIEQGEKLNSGGLLQSGYVDLSDVYAAKKDYKKAYEYHCRYMNIKDSVLSKERTALISEMDVKYQTEKKDKEILTQNTKIKVKEAEARQKDIQRNGILAGLILVLILALVIFKSLRDKQRTNSKLKLAYDVIEMKNHLVEEKNKNILDSINYAKRIQSALLASDTLLNRNLPEYFVFYKPKDIVSGDFFWAHETGDTFLLCTGDCTGHGVPGAFMSLLSISSLNEIVIEKNIRQPNVILDELRNKLIHVLNPEGSEKTQDGMDCALCSFDFAKDEIGFAGANNNLWLVSDNNLVEFKSDRQPVGIHPDAKPFTGQTIKVKKGDCVYTLTDGFADQFGGPKGKKFKYKKLQELLCEISSKPMNEQHIILSETLDRWMGNIEQIDDILVIGIRI